MTKRYLSAKLFFGLAVLSAGVGAAMFRRGLPGEFYLNPLFLLLLPRLIPFSVAILSACFGMIYFAIEQRLKRPLNKPLAIVHLVSFLLGILGYVTITLFWWRVLGEEHAEHLPMPLWGVMLCMSAFTVSLLAFAANIVSSMCGIPRKV